VAHAKIFTAQGTHTLQPQVTGQEFDDQQSASPLQGETRHMTNVELSEVN
jgi:hypothetical protein